MRLDDPEDAKLVTLARAAKARTGANEGAAVRDLDGRTYSAATVSLPHLSMTALELAVAMAVSSGAKGLEAGAVCTESDDIEPTAVRDLGGDGVPVIVAGSAGTPRQVVST